MTRADALMRILADVFQCDAEALPSDAAIHGIQTWDSLTHIELIVRLEEVFRIELTQEEIVFMTTVDRIRETLRQRGARVD